MKRRLAALAVAVALTAVSCNVSDYSPDPFKPCPHGYVRVRGLASRPGLAGRHYQVHK